MTPLSDEQPDLDGLIAWHEDGERANRQAGNDEFADEYRDTVRLLRELQQRRAADASGGELRARLATWADEAWAEGKHAAATDIRDAIAALAQVPASREATLRPQQS